MVSGLLDTLWKELYQVVVGKFYSSATLGQYTRANQFSQLFSSNLTAVIQRVTFPVLSNIQDDKNRMVGAYRRIIKTTMFITAITMLFLAAIADPLLYCLIGPKWHEAATYLPLICIAGSLYPLHAINLNMLQVQGRSDLFLVLEIVKKVITLAPFAVGAFIGIIPMLYANLLVGLVSFFLNSYWTGKFLGYTSWQQLKDIAPSYGIASFIAIIVYVLAYLPISNWLILPLQMIIGVIVFITICNLWPLEEYKDVRQLCQPFVKKVQSYFKH
jgi:O-antigen/teichoic acid export membrane protein